MKKFVGLCLRFFVQVGIAIIISSLIACMPITELVGSGPGPIPPPPVSIRQIYIYKDHVSSENRGHWTNMMVPAGAITGNLIRYFTKGDKSNPFGGSGESIRIDFELHQLEWAGIAVASCANCWGKFPCPQPEVYTDLKGANRLVFHARGERGGEVIQVKVGITGDQPCGDSTYAPAESGYIRLTNKWEQYSISLRYFDLSRVITPFAIFLEKATNDQSIRIFLDEIYFEIP